MLRVIRPLNVAVMGLGVGVGALLAGGAEFFGVPGSGQVFVVALAAMFVGAGANAINDVFDRSIDRINRPDRPLPAGALSVRTARLIWASLSGAGLLLAAATSMAHLAIAASAIALLYLYSAALKRRPLVGNVAIAVTVAVSLPFGGLVPIQLGYGILPPVLAGTAFAFLATFARELVKDVEDVAGDRASGARTLAVVRGTGTTGRLAAATVFLTIAFLPTGGLLGLGSAFLVLAIPAAVLLVGAAWWALGLADRHDETRRLAAARASSVLKGGMLAGLGALALAVW